MNKIPFIILICLISNQICAVASSSVPKDYPTKIPPNFYGNSQTDSFRNAMNGSTDLTSAEQSERAALIPEKLNDRFFVRIGGNASSEGISSVTNESIFDDLSLAGTPSSTSVKTASNNIQLAFGYTWTDFSLDLEWLSVKSITYNGSLLGISPVVPYSTNVKGDALIFNLAWIFQDLYNFKFYGVGCLGLSLNQSTTSIFNATPTVVKKKSPAYGLGMGIRFNLISKLYADMSARYLILGRAKFPASASVNNVGRSITLRASRTWLGISANLMWLI
jgi:opacity protein-like surface antigen